MLNQEPEENINSDLLSKYRYLEARIKSIEDKLGITDITENAENALSDLHIHTHDETILESRVGGYGMALLGSFVFLLGIIFLYQLIQSSGYSLLSSIFGYASIGGIFVFSNYLSKRVSHMSLLFTIIGQLMLYYITLRLHYFSATPLVNSENLTIILLSGVIIFQTILSIKKQSELFGGIAMLFALITGYLSNQTHVMLSLGVLIAAFAVFSCIKYNWFRIFFLSMFLVYTLFIVWFIHYYFLPNSTQKILQHHYSYLYLFICAFIYSLIPLLSKRETISKEFNFITIVINGICFSSILFLYIISFFTKNFTSLFVIIALFCMIYSIVLKLFAEEKFTPAFFAMYGFVAISVSIYGIVNLPYTFLLLIIQSLYVVAIAIWFKSKIIVNMNTFLYLMLLITYFTISDSVNSINYIAVASALITAWVINWKKEILEITNDIIVNIYLLMAFVMMLFALYKSVSVQYITLSWTITAIGYFLLSIFFKNAKFRWMAIVTMLVAATYLFAIDLNRISPIFRIIAFLFLAVISLSISVYYIKQKKPTDTDNK